MPSTKVRGGLYWSESTKTFHYEFRIFGEKKNGDTGCGVLALAKVWLAQYKERLRRVRAGLEVAAAVPTLGEAFRSWQARKAPKLKPRSRDIVRSSLELHLAHLFDTRLDQLTTHLVDEALGRYLAQPRHSAGGANVVLRALNCVVGYSEQPKAYRTKLMEVQEKHRLALTAKRMKALFAKLEELGITEEPLALLRLMAGLGFRPGEARFARVEAVDLQARLFTPWDPERGTKGHESEGIPIPKAMVPHLKRMIGDRMEGYLIPGARAEVPARMLATQWIRKAREALGWPWLTPHELRSGYATMLLEDPTVSLKTVQHLLRHKHLKTTLIYLRANHEGARAAIDRLASASGL